MLYNKPMTQYRLHTLDGETAVRITPNGLHSGIDITVQNPNASGYIYVGGEGVTAESYGYRLLPNHAISFELPSSDALYLMSSDPNMKASVIQIGVINEATVYDKTVNPVLGVFIYRSANGSGTFSTTSNKIKWNYKIYYI